MNGKRKPSPELTVVIFDNEESALPQRKSTYAQSQDANKLVRSLQRPQKQKPVLAARDSDYDSVNSPGASSSASSEGPLYVRAPGFDQHAQDLQKPGPNNAVDLFDSCSSGYLTDDNSGTPRSLDIRQSNINTSAKGATKKKKSLFPTEKDAKNENSGSKKDSSLQQGNLQPVQSAKPRTKKDPLPMKLRALPQSFWQQPNQTNSLSPGAVYPILPPLCKDDGVDVVGIRSVTPLEDNAGGGRRETVSVANTDLLFSLFHDVEEEQRQGQPKVTVVRRGRPKKPPSLLMTRVLRDDDPCLVSTAADSILPLIPDRSGSGAGTAKIAQGQQVLAMVSLKDGDKSVSLPSLSVEHHYSQILSELVMKL